MRSTRSPHYRSLLWVSLSIIASFCLIPRITSGSGSSPVLASAFSQQQQLFAPDGGPNAFFGNSVAISGDTAVVGAFGAGGGIDSVGDGAAYVFVKVGGAWSLQQKLTAPDGLFLKNFGLSVAISGETVVVGSPGVDLTGAVYVFVRASGVWSLQQKLLASDRASGDAFGTAVAISGDTVVVTAPDDQVGTNLSQGSAYVFARASGVWSEQQHLIPSDGRMSDFFGDSTAISGNTVAVGSAHADIGGNVDQGGVYVYVRSAGVWSEQQILTASDAAPFAHFGTSVAISGDTLVAGNTGSAYVFDRTSGVWSEQQRLSPSDGAADGSFGNAVVIGGETIVVGANQVNSFKGAAYVFVSASGVWSEQQNLTASDGAADDGFGFSIAIGGETIVVGANLKRVGAHADQGSAYIFDPNTPPVITPLPITVQQGRAVTGASIATASDGETPAALLTVSVVPGGTATGIALSNIANNGGAITADVAASCTATGGTVLLRVTDSGGLTDTANLQVSVAPNDPPVITCPASLVTLAARPGDATAVVNYAAPTVTDDCGVQSVVCTPPSGTAVPVGTTTVACTATDTSANTAMCSFSVTVFDICLQDDTNPSTGLVFNSLTGDYRFCCGAVTYAGKGSVSRRGSVFTLTHSPADRRLVASIDATQNKGTATLQAPAGVIRGTISDRDLRNNSCQCALATGPKPVSASGHGP